MAPQLGCHRQPNPDVHLFSSLISRLGNLVFHTAHKLETRLLCHGYCVTTFKSERRHGKNVGAKERIPNYSGQIGYVVSHLGYGKAYFITTIIIIIIIILYHYIALKLCVTHTNIQVNCGSWKRACLMCVHFVGMIYEVPFKKSSLCSS